MIRAQFLLAIGLVLCTLLPATAAPKAPRPLSGEGILLVQPFPSDAPLDGVALDLFIEPGKERLESQLLDGMNHLSKVLEQGRTARYLAVTAHRGDWVRIYYDDADREAWTEVRKHWKFQGWEEFLKGKTARFFAGLKKESYLLLTDQGGGGAESILLSPDKGFRIIGIEEDRAFVLIPPSLSGWIHWRDRDGRFLVVVDTAK